MIRKINESGKIVCLIFVFMFAVMLVFNGMTLKVCDDYIYAFSFATGERIQSVKQIFPSMVQHYYTMNGRVLTHFLVQFMLMLPSGIFDVLNAGLFCVMIGLLYYYSWFCSAKKHNALLLLVTVGLVWEVTPVFGHVFLWLDGAVNYLWPMTFGLLYLLPLLWEFEGRAVLRGRWKQGLFVLLGFPLGALSETLSMGTIVLVFCFIVLQKFYKKSSVRGYMVGVLCMNVLGYLLMIKSPGTWKNRIEGGNGIAKSFLDVLSQYTANLQWMLILWIVLFVLAFYCNRRHRAVFCSAVFMFVSVILNFMHIVANQYPLRGMLGTTTFLIMANLCLLGFFWESRYEALICAIGAVCLYFAAVDFCPGAYDILDTYRALKVREDYILSEREKGNLDLEVSVFHTETKYSAAHNLRYLKKGTADDWPNVYMARYYGLNSITGVKEKK